ncbi:hypothetical protein PU02_0218 [Bartonella ancashensis]|uniref:Uncharacterized protein n=1 Tax=Bartonella ancashensis TaxID=1318743 RepID=A0A0M4LFK8_9HYPH|nr:hypothetical protein PU02_0218 [Bartonella ancashensis]
MLLIYGENTVFLSSVIDKIPISLRLSIKSFVFVVQTAIS